KLTAPLQPRQPASARPIKSRSSTSLMPRCPTSTYGWCWPISPQIADRQADPDSNRNPRILKAPHQNRLLRVEPVFGFVVDDAGLGGEDFVSNFLVTVDGHAVHEDCIIFRQRHQSLVNLVGHEFVDEFSFLSH